MKVLFTLLIITLFSVASIAQNIDLQEDTTVNNLYDSRQGSCAMADIDNDGDLDLIITGANAQLADRKTTLYSNDGLGNYTEITGTGLSNWSEGGDITFADVDGDSDQDLLITGRDGMPNYYANFYLNDGSGNFTLDPTVPFEPSIGGSLQFEDIDNDGDFDLFMNGYTIDGNQNILLFSKLYLNDGTGNFSEIESTSIEEGTSAAFLDMDNDNDMDLIVSGLNNSDVPKTSLYENDGFGNYSLVNNTPFENVYHSDIAIADSDNDGDLDILINGSNESFQNICKLYLNDGTGSFSLLTGTPFINSSIGTVDFADFDNDNDMDILVTGSVGGSGFAAHIYENKGLNNFNLTDSLVKVYNSTTAIGDIDGDNDLDVIIVGIRNLNPIVKPRVYKNMLTTTSVDMALDEGSVDTFIYPNPSAGIINIETENTVGSSIKIYNTKGELVYTDDIFYPNNPLRFNQSPGLYMVVIKTNNSTSTHKLILK
ncbi:MAG: hypothetical protein C0598_09130 [Marinilabiliales bacterium]|nr:MAG: hypothetical protein C0598_09130 [Marinilabiliales bacterium]